MNNTYGIQEICTYEITTLGSSDFCGLFTLEEWEGFEYSTDLAHYDNYSVRSGLLIFLQKIVNAVLRLFSLAILPAGWVVQLFVQLPKAI